MKQQSVLYIRKSTQDQNLSFSAQEAKLRVFCEQQDWDVVEVFTEEASGAKDDRDVLAEAVSFASSRNAKLVVLRVDRLGRKLSTVARLLEDEGLQICVAELGECLDPFVLGIYALLASKERELISKRTKDALAVLKAKGVKLGNPNLTQAQQKGVASMKRKADVIAERYGAMINNLRLMGKSYRECGELLNLRTKKGSLMGDAGVRNIHKRWEALRSNQTSGE